MRAIGRPAHTSSAAATRPASPKSAAVDASADDRRDAEPAQSRCSAQPTQRVLPQPQREPTAPSASRPSGSSERSSNPAHSSTSARAATAPAAMQCQPQPGRCTVDGDAPAHERGCADQAGVQSRSEPCSLLLACNCGCQAVKRANELLRARRSRRRQQGQHRQQQRSTSAARFRRALARAGYFRRAMAKLLTPCGSGEGWFTLTACSSCLRGCARL